MTLFYASVKWYNEAKDEMETNKFYTFAYDYAEVGQRINDTFPYIESVMIRAINQYCDPSNFLYVDTLSWDERKKINECNDY